MRDAFDRNCAFGQREPTRLPIAMVACAALLVFVVLGTPAQSTPAPGGEPGPNVAAVPAGTE